jgi:crotonobetainyl-CoA:carnitine CoA-transferase CaiB-like acyl-CoA transferase
MRPLAQVTVVEMGSVVLAPYAAQLLAELGATVIKIEPPAGDITRNLGHAIHPGMGAVFLNCNRGKKSVVIDVKQEKGHEALCRLIGQADIFLHNMRFDTAYKLGIGYEDLSRLNDKLIYCATYGYGAQGRGAKRPAYDDIIQAASGLAAMRERIDGTPAYAPTILADKTTALFVVIGIMGAVAERERTGKGRQIEVAMLETMTHFMSIEHLNGLTWDPPAAPSGYTRLLTTFRRPHRTKDGYLAVMPHGEKHWRKFFALLGRDDVLSDPRFADAESRSRNIDILYTEVSKILPTRTNAEWTEIFTRGDVPFGPINQLEDLLDDPHLTDVGFWNFVDHPTEGRLRIPSFPVRDGGPAGIAASPATIAPGLGEHTLDVLLNAGYTRSEVDAMRDCRAVAYNS